MKTLSVKYECAPFLFFPVHTQSSDALKEIPRVCATSQSLESLTMDGAGLKAWVGPFPLKCGNKMSWMQQYFSLHDNIVSWEREWRYHYSPMFLWELEGCYCCTKSMAIMPFLFSWDIVDHRYHPSGSQPTIQ